MNYFRVKYFELGVIVPVIKSDIHIKSAIIFRLERNFNCFRRATVIKVIIKNILYVFISKLCLIDHDLNYIVATIVT